MRGGVGVSGDECRVKDSMLELVRCIAPLTLDTPTPTLLCHSTPDPRHSVLDTGYE